MRILRENTAGLIIDIQERLLPHMHEQDLLLERNRLLIQGLQLLGIPLLVTQQYSRGLGPTVDAIAAGIPSFRPIEKTAFSCCDEKAFGPALEVTGKKQIIVAGIEAHVCVLQTVIDLLEQDYLPVVIEDGIASRKPGDKHMALRRMEKEGAVVSTVESILFELLRYSGTDLFKAISKLIK